jgi:hypothetical protein
MGALFLERLHRSAVTVAVTIKSGSHNDMNQIFMDTVENVSPTLGAVTIKFMVMVMATINSGSLWRDFPKTINICHKPSLWSTYLETTILQCAQVRSAEPYTYRRAKGDSGHVVAKRLARSSWRRRWLLANRDAVLLFGAPIRQYVRILSNCPAIEIPPRFARDVAFCPRLCYKKFTLKNKA